MNTAEMKARLREIGVLAKQVAPGDTDALNRLLAEATELEAKIAEAENRASLQRMADSAAEQHTGTAGEGATGAEDTAAARGRALVSGKKVRRTFDVRNTITSSSTVMTQHTAPDVLPGFNPLSSLVDRVRIITLPGGESYKRGFVKSYAAGDYTDEGAAAKTAEADGDVRVTVVGKNQSGFTLAFAKDKETVIDAEFKAQPHDTEGTLIKYEEETGQA